MVRTLGARFLEGFFILLPVLLAYLMWGQLFDLVVALTAPVADLLPRESFAGPGGHRVAAALVLILICLVVGLLAATGPARRLGTWIEGKLFGRFPPYVVLKSLSAWISGKGDAGRLQPALLEVSPDTRMLVAIVEELPDDRLAVFVPMAPTPGLGVLQIVSRSRVEVLQSSMTDALGWLLNWGVGTEALLAKQGATDAEEGGSRREPG